MTKRGGAGLVIVALCWGCVGPAQSQSGEAAASPAPPASPAPVAPNASHGGAMAHGDHRPHDGGIVMMNGDLHFEVVATPAGRYQIYFSDEMRRDLPATTASEVVLTITRPHAPVETLILRVDDTGESWIGEGKPLIDPQVTIRVAYVFEQEPYWIDIPWSAAPVPGKVTAT